MPRSCSITDGRRHGEERASPKAVSRNVRDVSRGVLPVINVSTAYGIRASNRNDGYARSSFTPVHDGSHPGGDPLFGSSDQACNFPDVKNNRARRGHD